MSDKKYFTRDTIERVKVNEHFKKVPNFQLVRPETIEQTIERFKSAGRTLQISQNLGFDFSDDNIDYSLEDITRDPDFDLIDAAVAQRDALLKLQSARSVPTDSVFHNPAGVEQPVPDSGKLKKEEQSVVAPSVKTDSESQ